jgi:2-dehydropantoate 2-reductase
MSTGSMTAHDSAAPSRRQSVAVIGLGSIGGAVAGLLRAADRHDVVACVRTPISRLVVERPDDVVDVAIRTLTDQTEAGPVDWVLLCTKVYDTASAAPWLSRLCGPGTRVAALQNGMGHTERLAPLVGQAVVMPVLVYFNGERLEPGRVRLRPAGSVDMAVANTVHGEDFAHLFEGTRMRVLCSPDVHTLAWRKLLLNASANPISALTLRRNAVFRRDDIQALCLAVLDEAAAVGRADGARLAGDEAAQMMRTLLTYPPDAGTSMYFDRLAGRPTEIEAVTGAVVAAGERLGVPTPLNRMALTLLRAINEVAGQGTR